MAFCEDMLDFSVCSGSSSPGSECDVEDQRDSIVAAVEDLIGADASVAVGCGSAGVSGEVIENLLDVVANNSDLIDANDVPAIADQVADVLEQEGNGASSTVEELVEAISEVVAENILYPEENDDGVSELDATCAAEDMLDELESVLSCESDGGAASITVEESTTVSTLQRNEDGEMVPDTVIEEINETTTTIEPVEEEEEGEEEEVEEEEEEEDPYPLFVFDQEESPKVEEEEEEEEIPLWESDKQWLNRIMRKNPPKWTGQGGIFSMVNRKQARKLSKWPRRLTSPVYEIDRDVEQQEEELWDAELEKVENDRNERKAARPKRSNFLQPRYPKLIRHLIPECAKWDELEDVIVLDDNICDAFPDPFMDLIPTNEQLEQFVASYLYEDNLEELLDMSNIFHGKIYDFIAKHVDYAIRNADQLFGCPIGYDFELDWIKKHVSEQLITQVDEWRIQQDFHRRVGQGYAVQGPWRFPNADGEVELESDPPVAETVCVQPVVEKAKPTKSKAAPAAQVTTTTKTTKVVKSTGASKGAIPKVVQGKALAAAASAGKRAPSQPAQPAQPAARPASSQGAIPKRTVPKSLKNIQSKVSTRHDPNSQRAPPEKKVVIRARKPNLNQPSRLGAVVKAGPSTSRQPASRPASQPASRPASQPASRPASKQPVTSRVSTTKTTTVTRPASTTRTVNTARASSAQPGATATVTRGPTNTQANRLAQARKEAADRSRGLAVTRSNSARRSSVAAKVCTKRTTAPSRPASTSRAAPAKTVSRSTVSTRRPATNTVKVTNRRTDVRAPTVVDDATARRIKARQDAADAARRRQNRGASASRPVSVSRPAAPAAGPSRPSQNTGTGRGVRMVRAAMGDGGADENRATQERCEVPTVRRIRPPGSTNNGPRMVRAVAGDGGASENRAVAAPTATVTRSSSSGIRPPSANVPSINDLDGLMASMASIARNAGAFQSGLAEQQAKFCRR